MKTPSISFKKPELDLSKKMPYIFIVVFLVVGLSIVAFGYFLLNRAPDANVVSTAKQEVDNLSATFDKNRTKKLFDTTYDTSGIENPGYITKNPFLNF
ncbi:MAG: hypothetical protein Q7S53_04765 [bacterium]|nr:hypothetical protein [bacterium]